MLIDEPTATLEQEEDEDLGDEDEDEMDDFLVEDGDEVDEQGNLIRKGRKKKKRQPTIKGVRGIIERCSPKHNLV